MTFVQIVQFDGTPANAHDTGGNRLLINGNRITRVSVGKNASEHTDEAAFKWLTVYFVDSNKPEHICPFDATGLPVSPTAARGHDDELLLQWFEWVAR